MPIYDADFLYRLQLAKAPFWARYLAPLVLTVIATIIAVATDAAVTIPNLSLIFVLPVVVTAVAFGFGPSLFAALLGALSFNFFLTEPRYSLTVDDPANVWAIGLLFVVGGIASAVASTARRRADDAVLRERQAVLLRDFSQRLSATSDVDTGLSATADVLHALYDAPAVVLLNRSGALHQVAGAGTLDLQERELKEAGASLVARTVTRAGLFPTESSRFDFWPLPAPHEAVLGVAFGDDRRPSSPDILAETVGFILSLALSRRLVTHG